MGDEQPDTGEQGKTGATETGAGGDTPPPGTGTGADTATGQDLAAEVAKWKALAQKHEGRAKENAEAAQKLAEIENSQKSEQQKLTERAETAERRAAEAEIRVLRADVAAAKGVPAQLAQRLVGSTREELEADADVLLQTLTPTKPKVPPADAVAGQNGTQKGREPRDIFASMLTGG